ncbi:uncharacterized protein LOC127287720 [Leptopilina boulardi]|uniref:uncharacterized protein LOC127287720 n=1 Tax=Leptopilina boulardi TaxID=63433 RepID=UPI0021F56326|nr:uncharacterized protein LOC127287720 [Leptopilina boulardi]
MIVELSTIHLFIFLFFQISSQESVLLDDIIKQIRENEFEPYQTIIMHDGKEKSIEILNEITPIALKDTPSYKFVVPILKKEESLEITFQTSIFMVILSCGFVIFIWLILWFLKFDKRFLQFLHYLELLLGISVPYDVNKLTDRIILITILFGFWQFSSSLHSILTSTSVNKENDDLINTLKDLKESTLIPYVFPGIDYYSNNTDNEIMKKLIDRSKNYTSEIDCILELRKNKNIACLMLDTNAQLQLWKDLDKNGLPTVKIIDEVIAQDTGFIICELNSPYIFEFERHMGKIIQSGLYYKWLNDYLNVTLGRREIIGNSFGNEENVLELSLIIILAVGFTISIIVFFIELLINNKRQLKTYFTMLANTCNTTR